jgi:hypothetical protein
MNFCHFLFAAVVGLVMVMPITASAQSEGVTFKPYLKIYPEFKVEDVGQPSRTGGVVGNMGTLRNDSVVLSKDVQSRPNTSAWEWSNSYVGLRGEHASANATLGFDLQYEINFQGTDSQFDNFKNSLRTRDAYLFYENDGYGRFQLGKFDSLYKDWGDRYPMLGMTSGNFIANSRILSQAGWRGGGSTSFNNRRNYSLLYVTPSLGSVKFGVMHSYDAGVLDPGGLGTKLNAMGVRWDDQSHYAAFMVEQHIDWLPMSAGSVAAPGLIRNNASDTSSNDIAYRLALGWSPKNFRVGFDLAQLNYRENASTSELGRFRNYQNESAQLTIQYIGIDKFRLAVNAVYANAGRCEFSGNFECSTQNMGGSQASAGVLYSHSDLVSFFGLLTKLNNNPGSRYGSVPQGADSLIFALGIKIEQR